MALQITGLACDILLIVVWSRLWILSDARKRYGTSRLPGTHIECHGVSSRNGSSGEAAS